MDAQNSVVAPKGRYSKAQGAGRCGPSPGLHGQEKKALEGRHSSCAALAGLDQLAPFPQGSNLALRVAPFGPGSCVCNARFIKFRDSLGEPSHMFCNSNSLRDVIVISV